MIGKRAGLAAVLSLAALQAHASKFPGAEPWVYIIGYAAQVIGIPLAAAVFAFRLARVCHPERSRVRQALLGAVVGVFSFCLAVIAALIAWILVDGSGLRTVAHIAAALTFLAMIYAGYRLSTRYAASAPRSVPS